jgi:hypothetical protein
MGDDGSGGWCWGTGPQRALKNRAHPSRANLRPSAISAMAAGALTTDASAIASAAAFPPCALPAAGRLGAAFRPASRLPRRDRQL